MHRLPRTKTFMGSALVLALVLHAGCASTGKASVDPAGDMRAAIEETVADEGRRDELLALTTEWAELIERLAESLVEARGALDDLVADYGSERKDFDEFFADYEAGRADLGDRIIKLHAAMQELATDEEWRSLEQETQSMTTALLSQDLASAGSGE